MLSQCDKCAYKTLDYSSITTPIPNTFYIDVPRYKCAINRINFTEFTIGAEVVGTGCADFKPKDTTEQQKVIGTVIKSIRVIANTEIKHGLALQITFADGVCHNYQNTSYLLGDLIKYLGIESVATVEGDLVAKGSYRIINLLTDQPICKGCLFPPYLNLIGNGRAALENKLEDVIKAAIRVKEDLDKTIKEFNEGEIK